MPAGRKKGFVCSRETKARISASLTGRHRSAETRRKIGEARKGKPSAFKGRKHSEKTKAKMRRARNALIAEARDNNGKEQNGEVQEM